MSESVLDPGLVSNSCHGMLLGQWSGINRLVDAQHVELLVTNIRSPTYLAMYIIIVLIVPLVVLSIFNRLDCGEDDVAAIGGMG